MGEEHHGRGTGEGEAARRLEEELRVRRRRREFGLTVLTQVRRCFRNGAKSVEKGAAYLSKEAGVSTTRALTRAP